MEYNGQTLESAQSAVIKAAAVVKCQQSVENYRRQNSTSDTYIVAGHILNVVHWHDGQVKLYDFSERLHTGSYRLEMRTSRETKESELQAAESQLARLEMAAHLETRRTALAAAPAPAAPVAQPVAAQQPRQIHADELLIGDVIAVKDERYKVTAVRPKGSYIHGWYEIVDTRAASLSPMHRTLMFEFYASENIAVERTEGNR